MQRITNSRGETVEVLDLADLNRALFRLVAFLVTIGLSLVATAAWATAAYVRDTDHDIEQVEAKVTSLQQQVADLQSFRGVMDSLRIDLKATRKALEGLR